MKDTISRNLRRLRGKKLQKEIADGIGVKLRRYQAWEEGRSEPSSHHLLKLKEFHKLDSCDDIISEAVN